MFERSGINCPGFRGGPLGEVRQTLQPDWLIADSSFLQLRQEERSRWALAVGGG